MKLTSHFPIHQNNDHNHHPFVPNRSSSVSCHFFFDSTQDHHAGFYDHHQLYPRPNNHVTDGEKYGSSSSSYEMKNVNRGVNLSVWKKEDESIKWMSSKMRLMQKMKSTDDDEKLQPLNSSSSDLSSNTSSSYTPIRVCSDCNTTKTPLWRSGPKGPKSLCNACGIRQRKARRAMAAAIAASTANTAAHQPATTTTKIKLQHKGKKMSAENALASHLKKRCKTTSPSTAAAVSPSNDNKKLGFEDFLINLSKNLAFHRVFPDDEKDAAILLMALSSGLLNG